MHLVPRKVGVWTFRLPSGCVVLNPARNFSGLINGTKFTKNIPLCDRAKFGHEDHLPN